MTVQGDDKFRRITEDIDETQSLMNKNITNMTYNLAAADEIEGQTAEMMNHANDFRHAATNLKRTMWWKNTKLWLIIGGVAAIILIIIIIIIIIAVESNKKE